MRPDNAGKSYSLQGEEPSKGWGLQAARASVTDRPIADFSLLHHHHVLQRALRLDAQKNLPEGTPDSELVRRVCFPRSRRDEDCYDAIVRGQLLLTAGSVDPWAQIRCRRESIIESI
jgi:hypothetical protein